jgi:hypothetical protein
MEKGHGGIKMEYPLSYVQSLLIVAHGVVVSLLLDKTMTFDSTVVVLLVMARHES